MKCAVIVVVLFTVTLAAKKDKNLCDRPCPTINAPVCGSNGITYGNKCVFERASCRDAKGLEIAHKGACRVKREAEKESVCATFCTWIYWPVCGSDGVTYSNECMFDNANCAGDKTIAHEGECKKPKPDCSTICAAVYEPVCGSDGKSYPNKCLFESAKCTFGTDWTIAYEGECKKVCDIICIQVYQPVCGSDGKTYSNGCVFEMEKCNAGGADWTISYEGECKKDVITTAVTKLTETSNTFDKLKLLMLMNFLGNMKKDVTKPSCLRFCIMIYIPVCGSNGVTYTNACVFNNAKCRSGEEWEIAYRGACRPASI